MAEQSGTTASSAPEQCYAPLSQSISDDHPVAGRRGLSPAIFLLAGALLAGLILTVWVGYMRGVEARRRAAPIPRIAAVEPYKERAETTENKPSDHADKRIFDQVDGYARSPESRDTALDPPAETDGDGSAPALRQRPESSDLATDRAVASLPPTDIRTPSRQTAREADTQLADTGVPSSSEWGVQVASMPSRAEAQTAWQRILAKDEDLFSGLEMSVVRVDLGDRGVFFRVRVRGFSGREAASSVCARYKGRGGDCFVVRS